MQSKCLQPKTSIFQLKSLLGKIKVKKRKEKKKKKRKKGKKKENKFMLVFSSDSHSPA